MSCTQPNNEVCIDQRDCYETMAAMFSLHINLGSFRRKIMISFILVFPLLYKEKTYRRTYRKRMLGQKIALSQWDGYWGDSRPMLFYVSRYYWLENKMLRIAIPSGKND